MPQMDTFNPHTPPPKAHIWVPVGGKGQEQSTVPHPGPGEQQEQGRGSREEAGGERASETAPVQQ